jgi:hypothetical protein
MVSRARRCAGASGIAARAPWLRWAGTSLKRRTPTVRLPRLQLFSNRDGYTYNDYIILPGHISFDAKDVVLAAQVTKSIKIHLPFVSSPMDTVRRAGTLPSAGPEHNIAV